MDDSRFLADLAQKLRTIRRRRLATQTAIEARTGVCQETVSKVLNGRRRRRTEELNRLDKYADMLLSENALPPAIKEAVGDFLAYGTEDELLASLRMCARLVAGRRLQSE